MTVRSSCAMGVVGAVWANSMRMFLLIDEYLLRNSWLLAPNWSLISV